MKLRSRIASRIFPTDIARFKCCTTTILVHPVLAAGSRLHAPVRKVGPRNRHAAEAIANWNEYSAPDPGYVEEVYFLDLASDDRNRSLVLLTNDDESLGASIRYRTNNLPCFTLWKNTVGAADGYVTGLEPGTNFPNPRSFEEQQGRVVGLDAGESLEFEFSIGILVGRDQVRDATDRDSFAVASQTGID